MCRLWIKRGVGDARGTEQTLGRFNPMTRKCFPLSGLVLLSIVSYNCGHQEPPETPQFITATGTYKVFGGQTTVDVFESQGNINYRITRHRSTGGTDTTGPVEAPFHKGDPWFLYPASPKEVWIFDGRQNLELTEFFGITIRNTSNDEALRKAPAAVLDRLPQDLNRQ